MAKVIALVVGLVIALVVVSYVINEYQRSQRDSDGDGWPDVQDEYPSDPNFHTNCEGPFGITYPC